MYISFRKKKLAVHRIVYAKYGGQLDSELVINHLDGNPANNHVENLELVSQAANNLHRFRVLGRAPVIGNKRISKQIADEIRHLVSTKQMRAIDCARKYGIAKSTVTAVLKNQTWK